MKAFGSWVARALTLWIVMAAATVAVGVLLPPAPHPGEVDGPLAPLAALLLVTGAGALVMAGLASRLAVAGWRRPAVLWAVLFLVETGLSWIEAVFFNDFVRMSDAALTGMVVGGLIKSAIGAGAAALLWRRPTVAGPTIAVGVTRPLALIVLYMALYFVAGALVAWSSEAVRTYYGDGTDIDLARLALLQLGRGVIWTGLAALLALTVGGRGLTVAFLVGAAFAVLMAAPLLYPSAIIPWPVRQVHLVELALANFAFGALAVLVLRRRR